ncbi:hypothetical protein TNCV_4798731 [Trichonephila clavipes]|nr:hypothetical protein TNCV_4798731 [Trichonephila clavipes]
MVERKQEESIRTGLESVVSNRAALAREMKTKLTPKEVGSKCDVNAHVHRNDTQSSREKSNPAGAVDQGGIGFEFFLEKPCRGEHRRGPNPRKTCANTKIWWTSKNRPNLNSLGGVKFFPVSIGLTCEHNILVLKPSPCLHNGNEVDDWMDLDKWNSWV